MKVTLTDFCWYGAVLGAVLFVALFFLRSTEMNTTAGNTLSIGEKTWRVELALNEETRGRGLGYRDALAEGSGMLFVFETAASHAFWMRGMRFPLDILFIADGKVLSIERNIASDDTRIITPPGPVNFVLEVNAGESTGIEPGMMVRGLP